MAQTTKALREHYRGMIGMLPAGTEIQVDTNEFLQILADADMTEEMEAQIVGMMENIGELAWGIDLPTPFMVMPPLDPNAPDDEPIKPLALPPQSVTPFYEAIYQKWKKNSDLGHILRDLRRECAELRAKNAILLAQEEEDTDLISDLREKEEDYERLRSECEAAKAGRDYEGGRADRMAVQVAELEESLLHESDSASKWAAKCHQLEAETERLDRYLEESRDSRDAAIAEAGRLEAENQRLRVAIDQAERKAYGVAAMLTDAIAGPTEEDTEHDSPV